jgi:predicted GNAT family acetyltransferase
MAWHFTADPATYADHAWDLLAATPAEHTVSLTIIESALRGFRWSDQPMLFGWYADGGGGVRGAVSWTPPFELLLAAVPDDTVDALVAGLRERGAAPGGVNGTEPVVDRFVAAWAPAQSSVKFRMRLYRLGTLQAPAVPGAGRPARMGELDLGARWLSAFQVDVGVHATDTTPMARERIAEGRLWLWEDDGQVVSLAASTIPAAGVSRIAPVYTPPEHRRRGYGAAVTAACTADALARGADRMVLFTDLANPTSNSIYQQIGYRPVGDYRVVSF